MAQGIHRNGPAAPARAPELAPRAAGPTAAVDASPGTVARTVTDAARAKAGAQAQASVATGPAGGHRTHTAAAERARTRGLPASRPSEAGAGGRSRPATAPLRRLKGAQVQESDAFVPAEPRSAPMQRSGPPTLNALHGPVATGIAAQHQAHERARQRAEADAGNQAGNFARRPLQARAEPRTASAPAPRLPTADAAFVQAPARAMPASALGTLAAARRAQADRGALGSAFKLPVADRPGTGQDATRIGVSVRGRPGAPLRRP